MFNAEVYILARQKNSPPPPLKFFPVFVDFLAVFKFYKGNLTCVLCHFWCFSSLPPPLFFFKVLKIFPMPKGGGGNGKNIYPWFNDKNKLI